MGVPISRFHIADPLLSIALTEDTIVIMGLDQNGVQFFGRMERGKVHVITTHHSPDGTGHILSPWTDDEAALKRIEAACVSALCVPVPVPVQVNG